MPEPVLGEDLNIIRIDENVWNKESLSGYEKEVDLIDKPAKQNEKKVNLIEAFEGDTF